MAPESSTVIAGFRQLTGQATLMPEWAFGLWQSRQRYETDQQSLDVVDEFRADEAQHRATALANGAEKAPAYGLFSAAIKFGCRIAIAASERI